MVVEARNQRASVWLIQFLMNILFLDLERYFLTMSSHGFFLCGYMWRESKLPTVSAYKDTNPIGSRLHPYVHININYYLRDPISKYSCSRS